MLRHYGTPYPIDLLVAGRTLSETLVPSAGVQPMLFQPASLRQQVADTWPLARGIGIKVLMASFDQAATGGAALNWDQLPVVIDSMGSTSQLLGTIHDRAVYTGPVAKHLVEYVSNGYRYSDVARAQIAASDGDTVGVTLYMYLPFGNENFPQPEGFWPWVGWLAGLNLTVSLAAATAIAQFTTGGALETGVTLSAWIDAYLLPQPTAFVVSQWNRYQSSASAGNNAFRIDAMGQAQGLAGAVTGNRIAGMFELCSPNGMGGATTAENFTSFSSTELGQERVTQLDAFLMSYRTATSAGGPAGDGKGNPNTMAAAQNGSLLNAGLMYIPWRFCSRNERIENLRKWVNGSITLNREFTATPAAGMHTIVTNEIRELDALKWKELKGMAGLSNVPVKMLADRQLRGGQARFQAGVFGTRAA